MSTEKEKYIGESLIREEPGKKLKLKIGDKVIKKKHLSDEVYELFNDVDDLQNQIDSLEVAGVALSNEYGNDPHIGISQKKLTESYNEQTSKNAQYNETLEEHTTELENTYRKNETYSKEQLDNMITTPDQEYVTLVAESGDTLEDIFDGITGAADTIYRVGNWDGEEYNTGAYSEYAFDGTDFKFLSKKEPGIDEVPTAGSNNLVKSGGIYDVVGFKFTRAGYLSNYGVFIESEYHKCTELIPCHNASYIIQCNAFTFQLSVAFYNRQKVFVSGLSGSSETVTFTTFSGDVPDGCYYMAVCNLNGHSSSAPKGSVIINRLENVDEGFVVSGDKSAFNTNGYFDTDGNYHSDNAWRVTDYIPVRPGISYSVIAYEQDGIGNIVFYNSGKKALSTVGGDTEGVTVINGNIPDSAYYVRLCTYGELVSLRESFYGFYFDFTSIVSIESGEDEGKYTNWGTLEPSTAYSLTGRVFWLGATAEINIRYVKSIKFVPVPNKATSIYKVSISNGVATTSFLKSVANTDISAGDIVEVQLGVELGDSEYIGIGGSLCFDNTGYEGFHYSYCSTEGGEVDDWVDGSAIAIEYYGIIETPEEKIVGNEVVVDICGKGQYTSLFEAIKDILGRDTASNPITLKVLPGTYVMPTLAKADYFRYCTNRYLSIVGTDKVNCIIRNDVGYYDPSVSHEDNLGDNTPLKISGNVYISNLTIISTDNENAENEDERYHLSYCLHIDSNAAEGSVLEIHNCRLYNNHAPCIGFGIPKNFTLKLTDCELEANFYNPDRNYGGAILYGHDRNGSTSDIEEHIFIKNCSFVSSNGHAFKTVNNNNALMDCVFINNACKLPANKSIVLGNTTSIDALSYGNSLSDMNYEQ